MIFKELLKDKTIMVGNHKNTGRGLDMILTM